MSDLTHEYNNQRSLLDPETNIEYNYQLQSGVQYQLCMTFATDTRTNQTEQLSVLAHPAGYYCYTFDATKYWGYHLDFQMEKCAIIQ